MEDEHYTSHYNRYWGLHGGDLPEADHERASIILSMIPQDVESVLEAGCGSGIIVNQITEVSRMGLDISPRALESVTGPSVIGSIADMPFPDRSWDAVIASEVLEHIPEREYPAALSEMCRVANKYIIISVPNQEDLDKSLTRCPSCGDIFNAYLHLRSYSLEDLRGLFEGFQQLELLDGGETQRSPGRAELFIRHRLLGRYLEFANMTCPRCGYFKFPKEGAPARSSGDAASSRLKKLVLRLPPLNRTKKRWAFSLYERV